MPSAPMPWSGRAARARCRSTKGTWRAWATLDETLLFGSRARTALQTPLWIPQSIWLAGLAFFLLCLVFLALYVLVLLLGGQVQRVGHVAGIPHVSGSAEREG